MTNFKQTPNWQPISMLPVIAHLIDDGIIDTQQQLSTLIEAEGKPYALDDYTVERVVKVYTEQKEFLNLYTEQLKKWKLSSPSVSQNQEIERLEKQLIKFRELNTKILGLVDELKEQTIEKLFAKSDEEIGLEALLGKLKY
ncbi:hypothetical protein NIES2101_32000 [Calothrix sp. HK-06]|nr:hypothetical protein NIES2101_32000 [Calothrix sp. HK-06]